MNVVSQSTWRVRREESYIEGFHNTPSRPFLEGEAPIKKKNQGRLLAHVCVTTTLNWTISSGEWEHDRKSKSHNY